MSEERSHSGKSHNSRRQREMNSLSSYEIIQKLGQGTFGVVQKARNKKTKALVAIKQLINHSAKEGFPITALREITILRQLDNENVLKIVDMIYEEPKVKNPSELIQHRGCFYTVSPYMASDLVGLLENKRVKLELAHIKCIMHQLLKGIDYIHSKHFLHRDIKAANIMIDHNGVLKIGDFGLARPYHGRTPRLGMGPGGGERAYTALVVTRWYRPPEILLGERKYTTSVDMWGIGCVFGELFTHKPILAGQSDSHQAQLIFSLIGSPSGWLDGATLPNKQDFNIGLTCKRSLEMRFKDLMPRDGVELLGMLLALDPYKRINAQDALSHEFFTNEPKTLKPSELPKFEESHEIDKDKSKTSTKTDNRQENPYPPFPKGPSNGQHRNARPYPSSHKHHAPEYHPRKTDSYIPRSSSSSYQSIRDRSNYSYNYNGRNFNNRYDTNQYNSRPKDSRESTHAIRNNSQEKGASQDSIVTKDTNSNPNGFSKDRITPTDAPNALRDTDSKKSQDKPDAASMSPHHNKRPPSSTHDSDGSSNTKRARSERNVLETNGSKDDKPSQ